MEPTSITIYTLSVDGDLYAYSPYHASHALARRSADVLAKILAEDLQQEYGDAFVENVSDSVIDVCRDVDQYPQCYARIEIGTASMVVDYQNTVD